MFVVCFEFIIFVVESDEMMPVVSRREFLVDYVF